MGLYKLLDLFLVFTNIFLILNFKAGIFLGIFSLIVQGNNRETSQGGFGLTIISWTLGLILVTFFRERYNQSIYQNLTIFY